MQNRRQTLVVVATFFLALGTVSLSAQAQAPNATPFIDSLSPVATAPGRGQDLQLTILGTGFATGATVYFNGITLTPSAVTSTEITVTVPAGSLEAAGTAQVTVVNPVASVDGASNVAFFPITNTTASVSASASGIPAFNAFSVEVGDFNGDGKLDLAIATIDANIFLLGNGDGTFTTASSLVGLVSGPSSMAVGDFNGDGKLDLAVADFDSNTVSIMLGNGDGTFTFASSLADVVNGPSSVVVGDFNGNGKLDLAVANSENATVSVLLGNGDGTFQPGLLSGVGSAPSSVAVGDFNGDGKLDLAVANYNDGSVSILLGNGDGTFNTASAPAVGFAPSSVAVGDFNGDGKLDLAVANSGSNTVSILVGNGDGTFTTASAPGVNSAPNSVAVGDFNADGKLDLVVANGGSGTVSVLLGNGDGTFAVQLLYSESQQSARAVAIGDFNGDGKLDLTAIFSLACGLDCGGPGPVSILSQTPGPEAGVPAALPFGNQTVGTNTTLALTITNTGRAALNITAASATGANGGDFSAGLNTCDSPVSPGGNCSINVTFTPSLPGAESATLTVIDDAGIGQTVSLTGTGMKATTSTSVISLTPSPSLVGQPVTVSFSVSPPAGDTLTPSGNVTVSATTGENCTVTLPTTSCALNFSTAGARFVTASYAGDANFSGTTSAGVSQTVNQATATVTLGNLTATYNGSPQSPTVTTAPPGLSYSLTGAPQTNSGSYAVTATITNANYTGSASGTFVISQATASITLGNLTQTYTGSPLSVSAVTNPAGLTVNITYNGSSTPPTAAGSYNVVATIAPGGNYAGTATGTLVILKASQSITFASIPAQVVGNIVSLSASSTARLAVSFTSTTLSVCSVSGTTAKMLAVGTCTLQATQPGNGNYAAATPVSASFPVSTFKLTATPNSETIRRGTLAAFLLEAQSVDGFSGNVKITCSGGPLNSVCGEFPQTVNLQPNKTAVAISGILFPANTTPGTYILTFTGTSGSDVVSTTAQFKVEN